MSTITINTGTSFQTFIGWQATAQAGHDNNATAGAYEYPSATYSNYKTALLAAMLDLGINNFRVEIGLSDVNATGFDVDLNNAAIQPSTATSGQWHYDRMLHAMDDIVEPYRLLLADQGETPYIVLCMVDFKSAGYAAEDTPSEYSFFVNKFVDKFYTTYGYLPDAIEAILEPDNGANSNWNATKLANNIVQANADLVAAGYTGIKWVAPATTVGPAAKTWYDNMKTANPAVAALISEVAYHRYVAIDNTNLASLAADAEADGNTTTMNEHIASGADDLYDDLTTGHNTSWQQYVLTFPYPGEADDGSQYFHINQTGWTVEVNPRTSYLRHFFKYVRRGAVMKGVTNSGSSKGVPFVNSNGTYVVPIKAGAESITVSGLPAGTYGIRYTSGTSDQVAPSAYDQALSNQTITTGQDVTFTMPAAGYATVYDVNYMSVPAPVPAGGRGARRLLFR